MEKIKDQKIYEALILNNVILFKVQVFIKKNFIELYDPEKKIHIGLIYKDEIKTLVID
jgi:hypothetical protein